MSKYQKIIDRMTYLGTAVRAESVTDNELRRCEEAALAIQDLEAELAGLRKERERLLTSLTPSAQTKYAYIGEFNFLIDVRDEDGGVCQRSVDVPWVVIKEIMEAIRRQALVKDAGVRDE